MEKLKKTANPMDLVLAKVRDLCPAAVQGDKIDFERLRSELEPSLSEENETYNFTWVGKRDAILGATLPVGKTLRPDVETSKNWDETKNLYIEGDNLDVLKLLQESYLGKVKMIYIDPPYNTGNDFVYCDNFAEKCKEYMDKKGQCDVETNERLFKNDESNGRYHSNWCTMIYPRLKVARDLLSDDGVIFISIDDNEVTNLRKICDEVFGEENLLGFISTINNLKGRSDSTFFATCNEFLLVYAKQKTQIELNGFSVQDEEIDNDYKFEDEISRYKPIGFRKTGNGWKREDRPYMFYPVLYKNDCFDTISKDEYEKIYDAANECFDDSFVAFLKDKYEQLGYDFILPADEGGNWGRWRWGIDTFFKEKDINLCFNSAHSLCTKMRATIEDGSVRVKTAKTLWYKPEYDTGTAGKVLKKLFSEDIFNNPKSPIYLQDIVMVGSNKDSIVLDFFSGSATTAHAVMQLNAEDGGNRRFIMVQLPEKCDDKSEAAKAGYKTICDIGKERIRRTGDKIMAEHPDAKLDIGFKVFKLDEPNMKTGIFNEPSAQTQAGLFENVENIVDGRTSLDLLYDSMIKLGLTLDLDVKTVQSGDTEYFNVDNNSLIACFADQISESIVHEIAAMHPLRVVFRDSSFANDAAKINVTEIFKTISPNTKITVL